jgi:hypothetical protein
LGCARGVGVSAKAGQGIAGEVGIAGGNLSDQFQKQRQRPWRAQAAAFMLRCTLIR